MSKKARSPQGPSKVMETLSNAASMFQVPNVNMLATDTGMPVGANILMRNGKDARSSRERGLRPPTSTIMCPW